MTAAHDQLTILAPAFYERPEWSTRYLLLSAQRNRVPIHWYGTHEPYRGWHDVQLVRLLAECRRVSTPFVLYTDSSDVVMLTSVETILDRYYAAREPDILISVETAGDDGVNAGGWLAHTDAAIEALEWLIDTDSDESNPQLRWRCAIEEGSVPAERDTDSLIFQAGGELKFVGSGGRLPCLWHACGGYTDPLVGKAALIEPAWRQLGYQPTVEGSAL